MPRLLTRVAGPPFHPVYVRLSPLSARLLRQSPRLAVAKLQTAQARAGLCASCPSVPSRSAEAGVHSLVEQSSEKHTDRPDLAQEANANAWPGQIYLDFLTFKNSELS